ncbi:MAG: hypothetical protein MJ238_01585 [Bacilli bacterium]|nr:hypothetical protein [Bacilli bacterium]
MQSSTEDISSINSNVDSISSSNSIIEEYKREKPIMVYDIDRDFDSIPDGTKEIFLPEFGDKAITVDSSLKVSFNGETIAHGRSLYLYDVDGDGKRDVCTTYTSGSGYWSWYVRVVDVETKRELFYIHDRMLFDYYLDIKDDELLVLRCRAGKTTPIFDGRFKYENDTISVDWFDPYKIEGMKLNVYLANSELTPIDVSSSENINIEINDVDFYYFDFEMTCPTTTELPDDNCFSFVNEDGTQAKLTINYVGITNNTYRYCIKSRISDEANLHKITASFGSNEIKMTITEVEAISKNKLSDYLLYGKEIKEEEISKIRYSTTYHSLVDQQNFRSSYVQDRLVNDDFEKALKFFEQPVFEIGKEYTHSNLLYEYKYKIEFAERDCLRFSIYCDNTGDLINIDGTWYGIKNSTVAGKTSMMFVFVEAPETLSVKTIADDTVVGYISNLFDYDFKRGNSINSSFDKAKNSVYYVDSNPKMYISEDKKIYVDGQPFSYSVEDQSFFSWMTL